MVTAGKLYLSFLMRTMYLRIFVILIGISIHTQTRKEQKQDKVLMVMYAVAN